MSVSFFEALSIDPVDESIYMKALTHRSYVNQNSISKADDQQERLEFFGDAVLKFIVSYFLMKRFQSMEEGKLTKIRARIISDKSLAVLATKLKLYDFVLISDSEKSIGGERRAALLANTFEAILGAMYFDRGVDYTVEWFSRLIDKYMSDYLDIDHIVDYKTYLQEQVQRLSDCLPVYECLYTSGPEHKKVFYYQVQVEINQQHFSADGHGDSKKEAQQVYLRHGSRKKQKR